MKLNLVILAFCLLSAIPTAHAGGTNAIDFYLQLVRGTESDRPPAEGSRRVGPKLSGSLSAVFKWPHYWEIKQQAVALAPGEVKKVTLSNERAVEIDLRQAGKQKFTALSENKRVTTMTQRLGDRMLIIGADRDAKSAWFVVARRDKPSID